MSIEGSATLGRKSRGQMRGGSAENLRWGISVCESKRLKGCESTLGKNCECPSEPSEDSVGKKV